MGKNIKAVLTGQTSQETQVGLSPSSWASSGEKQMRPRAEASNHKIDLDEFFAYITHARTHPGASARCSAGQNDGCDSSEQIGSLDIGIETNSMQFYPDASADEAKVHPGLYQRVDGFIDLRTISGPGFGYRIEEIDRQLPQPARTSWESFGR